MGWIEGDKFERLRALDACGHIVKVDCMFYSSRDVGGGGEAFEGLFRFNAYGCPKDHDRGLDRDRGNGDGDGSVGKAQQDKIGGEQVVITYDGKAVKKEA